MLFRSVNRICLMEGELPKEENEIGIDRMYADNNAIAVGDIITVGENKLTVTGLVALSDYSALFSDNSDMMFDSVKFGVAVMTKEGFATYPAEDTTYDYSWKYESEPKDEIDEKEKSDNFLTFLSQKVILEKYVPAYSNQAIQFTGGDLGSDRSMFIVLLYILITIIAFIFAITTNNTITREANVIGTLRASGYTKMEIVRHYMAMPLIITVIAAILGNVLGYTYFKDVIASLYYGSYSLPTDIYEYPASLSVFMNQQDFSEKFDLSHDYYHGYFSNEEITDIDKAYIGATITKDDLTKITRQLNVSMGSLFHMIKAFAVILFMMLVFLLTKLVVEKNANAISMVKILGYENREIKKLYLTTSRLAVIISLVLSLPVSVCTIKAIYREMMGNAFLGWLTFYIQPVIYVQILLIGFITYMLVEVLLYQKIKKVPMDEALKNVE